jgi:TolB-like protein/tRNA A-37 threonylcarbamoyl transferase component Bud32/tetratricopeptide (TPR) repeat protein
MNDHFGRAALSRIIMDFDPNASSGVSPEDELGTDGVTTTESTIQESLKGRYQLVRELGRGGFGVSYLATDTEVASRKVVVKVLQKRRSEDAWSLKKFKGEMQALARIDHPGVVAVVDFGHLDDERPFLVMQYVAGKSLRSLIRQGSMPLPRVANIVRQAARALTAAHEVGVCHRDLKPENIMVQTISGEDQVKLIDFGIASVTDSDAEPTPTKVAGTGLYMAPEQFWGESSPASDIYQLGVVAYELATGKPPFQKSASEGLLQQKRTPLKAPPGGIRPDLPRAAQNAILRALSPDPKERFRRARDFGDALAAAIVGGVPEGVRAREPEVSTETLTSPPTRGGGRRRSRLWLLAAALALAALAAVLAAGFKVLLKPPASDSVAVLPFENRMHDADMEYLTEGITESLINDLSCIPTLRVSSRGSVFRYNTANVDPQRAGRELHVTRVVRGSVSRAAGEYLIEAELIDVRSGARLWGRTYTGKLASVSDALAQFSTEVTDQLRLKLSAPLKERLARQYGIKSQSYQDYLKGRFHLNKRTPADFESAVRYFEQAIAKDSGYAPAYAGLAYTYALLAWHASPFGNTSPIHALEKARTAAQTALELDGTLAEAYTALASVQMQADHQWDEAEKTLQRAIQLDRNWADAHESYALELAALGRFDESEREIQIAEGLELNQWPPRAAHATILYYARRYDDSLGILAGIAEDTRAYGSLGDILAPNYWEKSMPAEALAAILRLPATLTPDLRTPLLVSAYARAKQEKKAKELMNAYIVRPETAVWYYLALAHLALGQKAEALHDIQRDYERRSAEILFIAVDPMMDSLREDPRMRATIAGMRLR